MASEYRGHKVTKLVRKGDAVKSGKRVVAAATKILAGLIDLETMPDDVAETIMHAIGYLNGGDPRRCFHCRAEDGGRNEKLAHAAARGERWARSLKPGDAFIGCVPEAIERGYQRNTPECRLFVLAALEVLNTVAIYTSLENDAIITRIERMEPHA